MILCIGEIMVELSPAGDGLWRQGFAGDTFNTAWYLRRRLPPGVPVGYLTTLGRDPLSDEIAAFVVAAGIRPDIARHPTRGPGLYRIALTNGERSFTYWRDSSAARTLADDPARLAAAFAGADWLYASGITLAILPPQGREHLLAALAAAPGRVAFDPNIRPRLWETPDAARDWLTRAAGVADVILPSFDDEAALFDDASPDATAARYAAVPEGVVKNGAGPLAGWDGRGPVALPAPRPVEPVDTTGAGDSFNAAFLAARIGGAGLAEAVAAGHDLAARVVRHRGALMP